MKESFMRLCSLLLTIVMVINLLPINILASEIDENSATEETYVMAETPTESYSEEIEEDTTNEIEIQTEPVIEDESTAATESESVPISTEGVEPDLETEPVIETEAETETESMTGTEAGLETEPVVTEESDLDTEADTEVDAVDGAYIVEEIVENRTEYSKEYLLSTGLHMMTMYHTPVHYEVDGQWEEIDNTLQLSDGQYKNTEGVWDVAFPEEIDSESPVTITKDGYSLSFYMAGEMYAEADEAMMTASADAEEKRNAVREARKSDAKVKNADLSEAKKKSKHPETISEKTQSRLEYEDVYDNTDVRYDLQSNQLKESIIIGAYDETVLGYTYILRTGSLQPVLTDSGEILLYDEGMQNIVLIMPAPYVVDSNEQYSYDVSVELSSNNDGTYTLTYNLPMDWMADENRQWPVVLDPAVRAESTVSNVKDRAVYSDKTSSYDDDILQLGYRDGYGVGRAYLMYETLPELSSADVIIAASISLYKPGNSNYVCPVEVHKVLNTWTSSTITWSNKPNYDNTIEDYVICEDSGTYSWDITDIVREWYEGENTGMMFKVDDASESGDTETWKQFHSSDFGSGTVPVMYIVFRNNNGLESYWDYTASSTTRAGTGYINNYTGNLTWVHEDMGFGGTRTSVTINHIYNANDSSKNEFGLGYGWRTNYHQRVDP